MNNSYQKLETLRTNFCQSLFGFTAALLDLVKPSNIYLADSWRKMSF